MTCASALERALWNAVLTAEGGWIELGARSLVMEHALLRGRAAHPVIVGDDVLIGPHAHVNGARLGAGSFVATGAAIYPGAVLAPGVEVRINAVVQVNSYLAGETVVPIGWVAVGNPAELLPPERHSEIWAIQRELDFPGTVYGVPRGTSARELMTGQSEWFGAHREDTLLDP